jgi:hypothetical protein
MLSDMRCSGCPIPAALICQGENVRRFCELIDPAHTAYEPGYVDTLWDMGHRETKAAEPRSTVAEALEQVQAMHACSYRSIDPGCGCAGAKCGLRHGEIVSYVDCFECIRRYEGIGKDEG